MPAAYIALITKITFHVICFPATAILLANATPSSKVLGSVNGVAASTASLSRAFGPTITGYLHSKGLYTGYSVLSWWACGLVCALGAIESFWMEETDSSKRDVEDDEKSRESSSIMARQSGGNEVSEEGRRLLSPTRSNADSDSDVDELSSRY